MRLTSHFANSFARTDNVLPFLHQRQGENDYRKYSKKSDQCSRRRCDNEIVAALSKGEIAISKTGIIFALHWLRGRCDNEKKKTRRPTGAIFVDGQQPNLGVHN